ncbi:MAG: stalk domain-containing protein [Clostridia bacterium]
MKKFISMVLCVAMLAAIIPAAFAEGEISIYIDGKQLVATDVNGTVVYPILKDGTTYLPVRAVGEAFGKDVEWDGETNTVYVGDKGEMLQLYTDTVKIVVDGSVIDPRDVNGKSVPPFIQDGTTYLPVRAVGEAFNKNVEWNGEERSVILTSAAEEEEDELDGKYFRIYQRTTNKSVAVESASKEDSAKVVISDYADNNSQVWEFGAVGDGYYTVINRGSGKSLDIPAANKDAGVSVTQYTANGGNNQVVKVIKNEDGTYSFQFRHSDLYFTAIERYATQEAEKGDDSQCYKLEFVGEGIMSKVLTSPGYEALGEKQERFKAYLYSNISFSRNVKSQAQALLESKDYLNLDVEAQKAALEECMQLTAYGQVAMGQIPNESNATYEIVKTEYVDSYDVWRGTMKPVWISTVRMTGDVEGQIHEFEMITTEKDTTVVKDAINAIGRFPYAMRKFIKRIIHRNDSANYFNAGGDTVYIRLNWIPNENQIAQTLAHELGHTLDSNLTGDYGIWDRAIADDAVPMSGYGKTNRAEDLAEYSRLYHSVKKDAEALATIEKIYPNRSKAYQALLYSGDRAYYAQYKESFYEVSGIITEGVTEKAIALADSGKVLTVSDEKAGSLVTLAEYDGSDNQLWYLYPTADGSYVAFNKYSGMCLNVPGNSKDSGKGIIQWNGGTGNNEKMEMTTSADGSFTLKFKDSGLYLRADGDNAVQGDAAQWILK